MRIVSPLKEIYTLPRGSLMVGEPGDKPVCLEEGTANVAMVLRATGGFTFKMTEPWVVVKIAHKGTVCLPCVLLRIFRSLSCALLSKLGSTGATP